MLCNVCEKESKNLRVCPYCFTPYATEPAPGKRASTRTQPVGTGGAKSVLTEITAQIKPRVDKLWAAFRRQSPMVQYTAYGILIVLFLMWMTSEEPKFEAGVVQSDIIATPLQRDEALAIIRETRESAIVDIQQDEVFVSYPAATFPVREEGQLALVQQFTRADEIVEGRKRRIFYYNPNGKLFAQADGVRGVVLVKQ
jgi:hypothetical protein